MPAQIYEPDPREREQSLSVRAYHDRRSRAALLATAEYSFGGHSIVDERLAAHFLYMAQVSGAKTTALKELAHGVFRPVRLKGELRWMLRHRGVVVDPKLEWLGYLLGVAGWSSVAILWPFHLKSVALDFTRTFAQPSDLSYLADALVPREGKNKFFDRATSQLVLAVLEILSRRSTSWDLLDVLIATKNGRMLRHVLAYHDEGQELIDTYLPNKVEATMNIVTTIVTHLADWKQFALMQRESEFALSIDDWLAGSGILYLGGHADSDRICRQFNQLVSALIVSRLLRSERENPLDETWIFADEYRSSGLSTLADATRLLRSKGGRFVIAAHDIHGIASFLKGKSEAYELLGHFGNVWAGRNTDPDTCKFLGDLFGKYRERFDRWGTSHTSGSNGSTEGSSTSEAEEERFNAYPWDFSNMAPADWTRGYDCVARVPSVPGWRKHVSGEWIRRHVANALPSTEAYLRRKEITDPERFRWDNADWGRLGLEPPPHETKVGSKEPYLP